MIRKAAILHLLILSSLISFGQKKTIGDKLFDSYKFHEAIEYYEYRLSKGDTVGIRNLAEAYRYIEKFERSEFWYGILVKIDSLVEPMDYLHYSEVLRGHAKYDESNFWLKKYGIATPTDSRVKRVFENEKYYEKLLEDKGQFELHHQAMNSAESDFGVAFYKDTTLVFTSSRHRITPTMRNYNWNQKRWLDLYYIALADSHNISNIRHMEGNINTKYHDGPGVFTDNGETFYFTRNDYVGGKKEFSYGEEINKLQLLKSTMTDKGWSKPSVVSFSDHNYSTGHPTISSDGKFMIVSSDRPDGFGGSDLYYSTFNDEDSTWSDLTNLGEHINTEGDEVFPHIAEEKGFLFFCSSGHPGLGGLDIFVSKLNPDHTIGRIENLGSPINTEMDDFSPVFDDDLTYGYIASNRPGGKGDDDIYEVDILKPINLGVVLEGYAYTPQDEPLDEVEIVLIGSNGLGIDTILTDPTGSYSFDVISGKDYTLKAIKEDYVGNEKSIHIGEHVDKVQEDITLKFIMSVVAKVTDSESKEAVDSVKIILTDNVTGEVLETYTDSLGTILKLLPEKEVGQNLSFTIKLEKKGYLSKQDVYNQIAEIPSQYRIHEKIDISLVPISEGTNLEDLVDVNPINFDLGKSTIRQDAAIELDKIVEIMNEHPTMVVELGAHTDCRGSKYGNQKLSDKRAKASAQYIRKQINGDPMRIYGKGFGESILLVDCPCEGAQRSSCPEEEHAKNRRTEFKVIKL